MGLGSVDGSLKHDLPHHLRLRQGHAAFFSLELLSSQNCNRERPCGAGLEEEETYPSVEAAYQAAKTAVIEERKAFQRLDLEASMAKRMGQFVTMRKNWESVKVGVMASLLGIKFRDPELRARLLETSPKMLIEGVYYHDIFWGVCFCAKHRGEGLNNLGKLLMSLRHEIQSSGGIMR